MHGYKPDRRVTTPWSQLDLHRREPAIALPAELVPEDCIQLLHDLPIWFYAQTPGPLARSLCLDQVL